MLPHTHHRLTTMRPLELGQYNAAAAYPHAYLYNQCSWQYPKIGTWKKRNSVFFPQRHALSTSFDIFMVTYRVTNFLPKLVDCYYFLWKKLNFHFLKSPFFRVLPCRFINCACCHSRCMPVHQVLKNAQPYQNATNCSHLQICTKHFPFPEISCVRKKKIGNAQPYQTSDTFLLRTARFWALEVFCLQSYFGYRTAHEHQL